jgi:FG-GAP-like repeat
MFRSLLHSMLQGWQKSKFRPAKQRRASGTQFKPMLELLEDRTLLSFSAAVPYTIGTQPDGFVPNAAPQSIATGLFTSNGVTDMVVAQTADNSIYFLRSNGNGTFQPAVKVATFTKTIDGDVFAADFNGDGKLDLFVPTLQLSNGVPSDSYPIILLGNGDGTFQAPIYSSQDFLPASLKGTSYVRGWAVADFNGDGKKDLVGNVVAGGVTVMLGNGDGAFQAPTYTPVTMGYSRWLTAGDVNGDGKADVVIADGTGVNNQTGNSEITVLLGNGDGTFRLEGHYAAPATADGGFDGNGAGDVVNPEDVMVADLNHDGKLDVVESLYDHSIDVFIGNGDGSFQAAVGYSTGQYPRAVVAADVNGDGKVDLVVDNVGVGPGGAVVLEEGDVPGSIAVLYGNGDGTFQGPLQYTSIYYPGWVAVGDFNGDGLPDVAATQVSNGNSVHVMLNQSVAGAPTLINPASAAGSLPDEPSTIYTNTAPGTTINLSVLGADPGADPSPTYTWSVAGKPSGSANPTFGINNSVTANNTTATFSQAGLYTFDVLITDPSSSQSITSSVQVLIVINQAPTLTTAPAASPSPVNGTTTTLSVLPADDGGSINLTFTWAATGTPPAPVSFSSTTVVSPTGIGVNFLTTAAFSKAGAYNLQVTIADPEGRSVTSSVNVTVNQTLTSVVVTPTSANVADGGAQQFSAIALDQFGVAMASQPTLSWSATGLGSVSSSGLYTAPSNTGSGQVTATSGSFSGSASVTVTAAASNVIDTVVLHTDGSLTEFDPSAGLQPLSPAGTILSISAITDGAGNADVYAVTSDHHLWEHTATGWAILSAGSFLQLSAATNAAGNAVIFAVLTDHSLYENNPTFPNDHWRLLSPAGTILSISAVTDTAGNDDVYAVTSDTHLWEHTPTGWTPLSSGAFQQVSAGLNAAGQAIVFGVLTDHSLWENNSAFTGNPWHLLSSAGSILSISAAGADDVFAITSDKHLWEHSTGGWAIRSTGSFESLSGATNTAGQGDVFAVLTDTSFWEYDPAFPGWQNLVKSGVAFGAAARTR